jgi:hypothetical protein
VCLSTCVCVVVICICARGVRAVVSFWVDARGGEGGDRVVCVCACVRVWCVACMCVQCVCVCLLSSKREKKTESWVGEW